MRLKINLASQPHEVAQAYQRRMTTIIAALGAIAVLLVGYIVYQRHNSRAIIQQVAKVQGEMHSLQNEETQARLTLNKPANKVIADQSDFLNQLFARKSLSWTSIFAEMEKIVPAGLHVVSMKQEYTKTNDLVLHVVVATDSRDRAVEMVRHMEGSSHLRQAQIVAETVSTTNSGDQAAGGGNIQFDIAAVYVPGAADDEDSTPAQGEAGKNGNGQPPPATPAKTAKAAPAQTAAPGRVPKAPTGAAPTKTARNQSMQPGSTR